MSIPSWARKGVKVVCVEGSRASGRTIGGWAPQTDSIYVIRGVVDATVYGYGVYLLLKEYRHPKLWMGRFEHGWDIKRFRPLVTLEDDLKAHFSQYLNAPSPVATKEREQA